MKIALISYNWGEYCIRLASEPARNHEVCLLIPHQMADPHLALLNPSVRYCPFNKPRLRQPLRQIRVLMEFRRLLAYAFQKPVEATAVGGLPEMVDDGKTGYLIRPKDVEALANAVLDLLLNPARRTEFGKNGRKKLLDQCSPQVVASQTLTVYERALGKRLVA